MTSPVFDLHCDAVLKLVHRGARFFNDNPVSHVDIPKMKQGQINGLILSLWSNPVFKGEDAVKRTQYMLDRARSEIDMCRNDLYLTTRRSDLEASLQQRKITALLGIEGGTSIHNSLKHLEWLSRYRPKIPGNTEPIRKFFSNSDRSLRWLTLQTNISVVII